MFKFSGADPHPFLFDDQHFLFYKYDLPGCWESASKRIQNSDFLEGGRDRLAPDPVSRAFVAP